MICNKCGAFCDDQATVCSTCGEPLADVFELEMTPEELKKENTGKILGIISIVCAGAALVIGTICNLIATVCFCFAFVGYTIHLAGIIVGIISMIMSKKKLLGGIGVALNVAIIVIPLIIGLILGLLGFGSIAGLAAMEGMYY